MEEDAIKGKPNENQKFLIWFIVGIIIALLPLWLMS